MRGPKIAAKKKKEIKKKKKSQNICRNQKKAVLLRRQKVKPAGSPVNRAKLTMEEMRLNGANLVRAVLVPRAARTYVKIYKKSECERDHHDTMS